MYLWYVIFVLGIGYWVFVLAILLLLGSIIVHVTFQNGKIQILSLWLY